MAKPLTVPHWNLTRSNCVPPPPDKAALGYLPEEKPPAQYLNDNLQRIAEWLQYLSDGAFVGNHSVSGTLGVGGAATLSSTLAVSGATTIGGTLGVGDAITVAANRNVTLQGTGHVVDSYERTERFHGSAFVPTSGTGTLSLDGRRFGGSTASSYFAIQLPSGATIKEIGFHVTDNVSGTCIGAGRLSRVFLVGSTWISGTLDTTSSSNGTGTAQLLTVAGMARVVSASEFYVLHPIVTSGAGEANLVGAYFKWVM